MNVIVAGCADAGEERIRPPSHHPASVPCTTGWWTIIGVGLSCSRLHIAGGGREQEGSTRRFNRRHALTARNRDRNAAHARRCDPTHKPTLTLVHLRRHPESEAGDRRLCDRRRIADVDRPARTPASTPHPRTLDVLVDIKVVRVRRLPAIVVLVTGEAEHRTLGVGSPRRHVHRPLNTERRDDGGQRVAVQDPHQCILGPIHQPRSLAGLQRLAAPSRLGQTGTRRDNPTQSSRQRQALASSIAGSRMASRSKDMPFGRGRSEDPGSRSAATLEHSVDARGGVTDGQHTMLTPASTVAG